jgi:hypothetical protein
MFDALFSAIQTFFTRPEFLVPTLWVTFGCTLAWSLLSAQRWHAIDPDELTVLWETHKQFNCCTAKKFEPILKGKKIVGYKCQCGHQHLQKRPIVNFVS